MGASSLRFRLHQMKAENCAIFDHQKARVPLRSLFDDRGTQSTKIALNLDEKRGEADESRSCPPHKSLHLSTTKNTAATETVQSMSIEK